MKTSRKQERLKYVSNFTGPQYPLYRIKMSCTGEGYISFRLLNSRLVSICNGRHPTPPPPFLSGVTSTSLGVESAPVPRARPSGRQSPVHTSSGSPPDTAHNGRRSPTSPYYPSSASCSTSSRRVQ